MNINCFDGRERGQCRVQVDNRSAHSIDNFPHMPAGNAANSSFISLKNGKFFHLKSKNSVYFPYLRKHKNYPTDIAASNFAQKRAKILQTIPATGTSK
ncbi:MAG: hypothetical protein Q4A06_00995 [Cardiobacteriaceae bacterium]|nr:hypothetical protein [Cardiobacteriaceae bacterium]